MAATKAYGHRLPPVEVPDELRARLERCMFELQALHAAGDFPYGPWTLASVMRVAMGFGVRSIEQEIDRAKREAASRPLLEEMARENMHRFGPQEAQVRVAGRTPGGTYVPHVPQEVLDAAKQSKPPRSKGRQIGPGRKPR